MSKKSEELLGKILEELRVLNRGSTLLLKSFNELKDGILDYRTEEKQLIDNFKKLWETNQDMMKSYDNQIYQFTQLLESEKQERERKLQILKNKEDIEKLFLCLQVLKNSEWYLDTYTEETASIPFINEETFEEAKKKRYDCFVIQENQGWY